MTYYIVACQRCHKNIKTKYKRFRCCSLLQNTVSNLIAEGEEQKLRVDELKNVRILMKKGGKMLKITE